MSSMQTPGTSRGPFAAAMNLADRLLWRIEQVTLVISCAVLFTIMSLIFLDATLRYTLNNPLPLSFDLITFYLISAAVVLVTSYTLRKGGHVSVELFADMLPRRLYHTLIGLAFVATAIVLGIMAYRTTGLTFESWQRGEITVGLHPLQVWPSKGLVAFSLVLVTLRTFYAGVSNLAAGITGDLSLALRISHLSEDPLEEAV